ncbi:tRNA pseudouridine synthase TruA family protein, partial [Methanothrix soehngenii]|uniref:Conserved domain protein n=1 Tax=Methanothrix soehngenii (strain ATCC 5969 / DSM 3671 / JCM 10134 / NBRC 103675 / OCM 69 / GP-6) TaxID=990316 RepID=F4BW18_METSG
MLLGEHDFRNFSSAKVDTVKSWFSDLLRPERNHGAPTAPAVGLILMNVGYEGLV